MCTLSVVLSDGMWREKRHRIIGIEISYSHGRSHNSPEADGEGEFGEILLIYNAVKKIVSRLKNSSQRDCRFEKYRVYYMSLFRCRQFICTILS